MIGIIGGTGIAPLDLLEHVEERNVQTPFGSPSDVLTLGTYNGQDIAFLPRHGKKHSIPPGKINYRANIWALKSIGVTQILAASAVGSLQEHLHPGQLLIPDQFIDLTRMRQSSFYEGPQVCHISVAEPFCPVLRKAYQTHAPHAHQKGTYLCIEGPRFSTRAESHLYQSWKADVIGMTLIPECVLAREAELCYASVAMITDYDTFKEETVTIDEIVRVMRANESSVKSLLLQVLTHPPERTCSCGTALKGALL